MPKTPIQTRLEQIESEMLQKLDRSSPAEVADWAVRHLHWALDELRRRESARATAAAAA